MKRELPMGLVAAIICLLVIGIGWYAWRAFLSSPAQGTAISPQQAGLGKPVYPPGMAQTSGSGPSSGSPEGKR